MDSDSAMVASPYREIGDIILEYLRSSDEKKIDFYSKKLSDASFNPRHIISAFWPIFDLAKNTLLFGNEATAQLLQLGKALSQNNSEIAQLILLTQNPQDFDKLEIPDRNSFKEEFRDIATKKKSFPRYANLADNPRGFTQLINSLTLSNLVAPISIMGEQDLHPDTTLLILIAYAEITGKMNPSIFKFPAQSILFHILNRMRNALYPMHLTLLTAMVEQNLITPAQLWSIFGQEGKTFNKISENLTRETIEFCHIIEMPHIIGDPKPPKTLPEPLSEILSAITSSFFIKDVLLKQSDEEFISAVETLGRFDPCQFDQVGARVSEILLGRIRSNPSTFFDSQVNVELFSMLNCHTSTLDLFFEVIKNQKTPISIFPPFVLLTLSLNCRNDRMISETYNALQRFDVNTRIKIYKSFQVCQLDVNKTRLLMASIVRRSRSMFNRLNKSNSEKFIGKAARYIITSPKTFADGIIHSLKVQNAVVPELHLIITKSFSPLGLDLLLCQLLQNIEDSSWPSLEADYICSIIREHASNINMSEFIQYIFRGLISNKISSVCLLSSFINQTSMIKSKSDTKKADLESRAGDGILRFQKQLLPNVEVEALLLGETIPKQMQTDDLHLKILSRLDSILSSMNFFGVVSNPEETLDNVQVTMSKYIEYISQPKDNAKTLSDLIDSCGISSVCAIQYLRMSSPSEREIESEIDHYSPSSLPKGLFSTFWSLSANDLYLPKSAFENQIKDIEERKKDSSEDDSMKFDLYVAQLNANEASQAKRIETIREKLSSSASQWFSSEPEYRVFVSTCVVPRVAFSLFDSFYCSLFVKDLVDLCPNFKISEFYRALFDKFHFLVFSATNDEIRSFGLFLQSLFSSKKEGIGELFPKVRTLLQQERIRVLSSSLQILNDTVEYFPEEKDREEIISLLGEAQKKFPSMETIIKSYLNKLEKPVKSPPTISISEETTIPKSKSAQPLIDEGTKENKIIFEDKRTVKEKKMEIEKKAPLKHLSDDNRDQIPPKDDDRRPKRDDRERPRHEKMDRPLPREDDRRRERDDRDRSPPRDDGRRRDREDRDRSPPRDEDRRRDRSPPRSDDRRRDRSPPNDDRDRIPIRDERRQNSPKSDDRRERREYDREYSREYDRRDFDRSGHAQPEIRYSDRRPPRRDEYENTRARRPSH